MPGSPQFGTIVSQSSRPATASKGSGSPRASTSDHFVSLQGNTSSGARSSARLLEQEGLKRNDYGAVQQSHTSVPIRLDTDNEDDEGHEDGTALPDSRFARIRASSQSSSHESSNSSVSVESLEPLPTYRSFLYTHLALDLPMTFVILAAFILLSKFGWPVPDSPYPHRFHRTQFLTGVVTWIASEAIRVRIFKFFGSSRSAILSSTPMLLLIHIVIQESLRLFATRLTFKNHPHFTSGSGEPIAYDILKNPPRPPKGFFRAFDLALGFAGAEIIWRTLELLGSLKLYERELPNTLDSPWLIGEENVVGFEPEEAKNAGARHIAHDEEAEMITDHHTRELDQIEGIPEDTVSIEEGLEEEAVDNYIRDRKRLELERSLGGPLWDIPVIVVAIWRLDATLLNLTLTLFLALPFHNNRDDTPPRRHPTVPVQLPLWPTFVAVIVLHWILTLIWTLGVRIRKFGLGMPAISYGTLLLVLACFFASLGVWSALV